MGRFANDMPEIVMKDNWFVAVLNTVLRYAVKLASEDNDANLQARVTYVVEVMLLSDYLSFRSRQTNLLYGRAAHMCIKR